MRGWLFFDVGETLMDERPTNRAWAATVSRVLAGEGHVVTEEQVLQAQQAAAAGGWSDPKRGAVALLTGRDEDLYPAVRTEGWPLLDVPFPGARDVLQRLADAGYQLGLIANQPRAVARARLAWSGLLDLFEVTLLSDDVGLKKPDPAMFQLALTMAGCTAAEATMIGDRPDNDIAPAKRSGWRTIRVRQGLHADYAPRTDDEEADVTVQSLEELQAALLP